MDLLVFAEEIPNGKRKCLTAYDSSWEQDFQSVLLVKTNMRFIVTQKFIFCGHMVREAMFLATAILWSKNVKSINKSAIINHFLVPTAPTKSTVCNSWSPIKGNKCSVLSNFIFISFMCFIFSFLMNSLKQKRCQENSCPEDSHSSNSPLENSYPKNSHLEYSHSCF